MNLFLLVFPGNVANLESSKRHTSENAHEGVSGELLLRMEDGPYYLTWAP